VQQGSKERGENLKYSTRKRKEYVQIKGVKKIIWWKGPHKNRLRENLSK